MGGDDLPSDQANRRHRATLIASMAITAKVTLAAVGQRKHPVRVRTLQYVSSRGSGETGGP
jgi:hypothetical protein